MVGGERDHSGALLWGAWEAEWIEDSRFGDTIGFIDWSQLVAITWRWTGEAEADEGDLT